MPKTILIKNNGKQIEHNATGAVTISHLHWKDTDQGYIEFEWEVSSKEELLTIATEFLGWLDHVAPNGGLVQNAVRDWAKKTNNLNGDVVRLYHKQADHPDAKVDLGDK